MTTSACPNEPTTFKAYAATEDAKRHGLSASDFSYNTGSLACPRCQATGQVALDVQFLPDVAIACPDGGDPRHAPEAEEFRRDGLSLRDLLALTVQKALDAVDDIPKVRRRTPGPGRSRSGVPHAR